MKIVSYNEKYKKDFIEMNKIWISEMFELEKRDIDILNNINQSIKDGAQIFFAVDENDAVLACCMIAPLHDNIWEIEKFCAKGMYTGTGAGSVCLKSCIDYAKQNDADKIIIVSNTKCTHALKLYRKNGFKEVLVNEENFLYDRVNIAFELDFNY